MVVAGAGAGAGRALAVLAAEEGAKVVIGARTLSRLDETVALVRRMGAQITRHEVDLTDAKRVEAFFADAAKDLGGAIDVVFCLAGGWHEGSLETATPEEVERSLSQYLKGAIFVNRYAVAHLAKGNQPVIVNFSSVVGGRDAARGSTLYNATKAAITGLSRSLAADLLPKGIRVNTVLPGSVSHRYEAGRDYQAKRRLGAAPGAPEDLAHAAIFLASPEASWITGAELVVDGGWSVDRGTRHPSP